jgi:hypothetical protein
MAQTADRVGKHESARRQLDAEPKKCERNLIVTLL